LPVDREPTAHVAAKMSRGRARNESGSPTDAIATVQPAGDYAQSSHAGFGQLEDRRRRAVDVAID
jgi:hypothetical protein